MNTKKRRDGMKTWVLMVLFVFCFSISSMAGELKIAGYNRTHGIWSWSDVDFSLGVASYIDDHMDQKEVGILAAYLQVSLVKYGENFRINGGFMLPLAICFWRLRNSSES